MVPVVTVDPVVSTATASQFKFRSFDGAEHRGYEVIIPNMRILVASKEGINEVDEVWQLVRTSESDSSALSFIRIGCLDSLLLEETIPKGGLTAARRICTGVRRATPYRELSIHRTPATGGLRASSLRVDRIVCPSCVFPRLMTSEEAVRRTLRSDGSRRAIHSFGTLLPCDLANTCI
jgi:hypothetical protein